MRLPALVLIAVLASCGGGGGGGGGGGSGPTGNVSPGGIYTGTMFLNGAQRTDPIVGVVTEAGEGQFLDTSNGGSFTMQFNVSGNSSTGAFTASVNSGTAFPNNLDYEIGMQQSTIVAGQSITGTYTTANDSGRFTLSNAIHIYDLGSSLTTIAGNYPSGIISVLVGRYAYYSSVAGGASIQADGSFIAAVAGGQCALVGQVSIIDVQYNAYTVAGTVNCGGGGAAGFVGLGFFLPPGGFSGSILGPTFPPGATFTYIVTAGAGSYFEGVAQM